ncbi:hypothetical protein Pelo_11528 [Pelomyxa schiedti]|nr:hypothetical protein Pelo_11528 [Pelomyxa schiedti]
MAAADSTRHRAGLKLVCISDTHNKHQTVSFSHLPPPDDSTFVLHAGDFCKWPNTQEQVVEFNDWMGNEPYLSLIPRERKLVVVGNHDHHPLVPWRAPWRAVKDFNFTLLDNRSVFFDVPDLPEGANRVHFFGTSYHKPILSSWQSIIPSDCDILITHAPCRFGDRLADDELCQAVARLGRPHTLPFRVCLSGHAHERHFLEQTPCVPGGELHWWIGAAMGHHPPPLVVVTHTGVEYF